MNLRAARKIRETGGPTVMPLGAVADGELFKRLAGDVTGVSLNALTDPIFGTIAVGATLNRWYPMAGWTADALTAGGTAAANQLRCFPITVAAGHTIEQVAINCTIAIAASNVRLGIYGDNGGGYPDDLVADFGSVSTATTGVKTITGLSELINRDRRYWMAIWQSHNTTLRGLSSVAQFPVNGVDPGLGTTPSVAWEASLAYTTFPSTYPSGAIALGNTGGSFPVYFARFSS